MLYFLIIFIFCFIKNLSSYGILSSRSPFALSTVRTWPLCTLESVYKRFKIIWTSFVPLLRVSGYRRLIYAFFYSFHFKNVLFLSIRVGVLVTNTIFTVDIFRWFVPAYSWFPLNFLISWKFASLLLLQSCLWISSLINLRPTTT